MSLDLQGTRGAHPTPDFEKGFSAVAALGALDGLSRDGGGRDLLQGAAHAQSLVRQRTFDFPDAMLERLKIQAERDGISQGEAVRQALASYLSANQTPYPQPTSQHVGTPTSQPTGGHVGSGAHQHAHKPARGDTSTPTSPHVGESRARVEESSVSSMQREEEARHDDGAAPRKRKRDPDIDEAWRIYDEAEALRPEGGVLAMWRATLKGDGGWMNRVLSDLAARGLLSKGTSYVFSVIQNAAAGKNGNGRASPPKKLPTGATQQQLDEARLFDEMEGT